MSLQQKSLIVLSILFNILNTVTDYDDLVVPLRKHCPAALDVPNKAGVTPYDLLQGVSFAQVSVYYFSRYTIILIWFCVPQIIFTPPSNIFILLTAVFCCCAFKTDIC